MALLFMDGFDLYGAVTDLPLGRWTSVSNSNSTFLMTGRYSGSSLQLTGVSGINIAKQLATTYSTLVIGFAIKTTFVVSNLTGFTFYDTLATATAQTSVGIQSDGSIVIKRGTLSSGTVVATSAAGVITSATWAYLEAKITFATGATGTYEIRVNGVNVLSGTTVQTAASTASIAAFDLRISTSSIVAYFDDLYVCDTSTATNNNFLGDVRIETVMPTADTATKGFSAAVSYAGLITSQSITGTSANALYLQQVIPAVSGVIPSVVYSTSSGGSATCKSKGVVYADSSGVPGSRLAVSTEVVGAPANSDVTLPFSSPPSVTAGTTYYVGFITDTGPNLQSAATNATFFTKGSQSESTGPSDPAPSSMTSSLTSYRVYAIITSAATNWSCVKETGADNDYSYVQATATTEDLYSHAALSSTPATINAVQVTSLMRKADAGPRTVSNQCKSSSTDQAGATLYPGGSYQFFSDIYLTDPATGVAWTGSGVNSATFGVKIIS